MTNRDRPAYRDESILALFRTEVETQVAGLTEGLLTLERDPYALGALASLMRAAHSIKGAARVVDLEAAEQLAHAMEECFVAAQAGRIQLTGEHIEVLLQAVDCMLNLARNTTAECGQGVTDVALAPLLETLASLATTASQTLPPAPAHRSSGPAYAGLQQEDVPVPQHALQEQPSPSQSLAQEPRSPDRVVRVTMAHLNRLLGLAGESLVEARWLPPFATSLLQLKNRQVALADSLEKLRASLQELVLPPRTEGHLQAARQHADACRQVLVDRLTDLELFVQRSENLAERLYRAAIASHMRPFEDGVQGLPRMVRDLARQLGKQVTLDILGRTTEVDRDILERLEAPLNHLLRNAIDHGIETPGERLAAGKSVVGTLRVEARHHAGMLSITVADDGRGVDVAWLRQTIVAKNLVTAEVATTLTETEVLEFLFLPTFSTATTVTEISGRGVGLDVVQSMAQAVGGAVHVAAVPGQGMSFHLQLPLTLSVLRALVVDIAREPYAFPLARLEQVLLVPAAEVVLSQEQQYITVNDRALGLVPAAQVLEVPAAPTSPDPLSVVVVSDRTARYGLVVDRFRGEMDLVVQPLDPRLGKQADISAAALLEDGTPVLIIDVDDIVRSAENLLARKRLRFTKSTEPRPAALPARQRVLIVDDSLTVREAERRLLVQHGYDVEVAVDGIDGWNALRTGPYDLVITDVDMPRLDGIELVRRIKHDPRLRAIPVLIVSYKGREEDRRRGLEAGAQAYVTKRDFQNEAFLQTVSDLLNSAAGAEPSQTHDDAAGANNNNVS